MRRMVLIPEERLLQYERRESEDGKLRYENDDKHCGNNDKHTIVDPLILGDRVSDKADCGLMDDVITRGIPKTMRVRALALLERLKARPDIISWDSMGQVKLKGDLIPKSNISDLISDAMRSRKRFDPEGSRQFFCVLNEINVPRDLVRNEERWKEAEDVPQKTSFSQDRGDFVEPQVELQVGGSTWGPPIRKGWVFY